MRNKRNPRLRGEVTDLRMVERGQVQECASLGRMAEWSLNYLSKNPDRSRDYECRFVLYPSHIPHHCPYIPSNEYAYDVISLADTDVRMQLMYEPMRSLAATQTVTDAGGPEPRTYAVRWLGNSVLDVAPKAQYVDLFGSQRGVLDRSPVYPGGEMAGE